MTARNSAARAPVSGVSVAGARGSPFIAVTSRADRSPCLRAHDIYRISIDGKYQDEAGNPYHRQVHNPNGPHCNPDAAHATHIPWLTAPRRRLPLPLPPPLVRRSGKTPAATV
ncbi:polymorphic toxin type 30 domain-containing protein [Streptomyces hirsutus]|uniref:polymorphic toxin type 30 domain-containing protein n=1 Tax=Streptomyces hirsutus TaxID=35620 RepID=UPI003401A54D